MKRILIISALVFVIAATIAQFAKTQEKLEGAIGVIAVCAGGIAWTVKKGKKRNKKTYFKPGAASPTEAYKRPAAYQPGMYRRQPEPVTQSNIITQPAGGWQPPLRSYEPVRQEEPIPRVEPIREVEPKPYMKPITYVQPVPRVEPVQQVELAKQAEKQYVKSLTKKVTLAGTAAVKARQGYLRKIDEMIEPFDCGRYGINLTEYKGEPAFDVYIDMMGEREDKVIGKVPADKVNDILKIYDRISLVDVEVYGGPEYEGDDKNYGASATFYYDEESA